jgi:DNA polymerase-3 subunit delta'
VSAFDGILSQQAAVEWLSTAAAADRLPHGLIFSGPAGVGKGTTARALATLFLCEKPKGDQPCGKCEGCRGMAADVHPDYHIIHRRLIRLEKKENKASTLAAEVIRVHLNDKANNKSIMNRGKVFVVEEAELMNSTAQNSLLKTLEEPPGRTLIILLTTNANQLLPTIRSRCQLVRFSALPEQLVKEQLIKRGIDARDAEDAARISNGSLGSSIIWLEDGVIQAAREFITTLDNATPDTAAELGGWLKAYGENYYKAQEKRDKDVSKDVATREGLALMLSIAANHLRRKLNDSAEDVDRLDQFCAAIDAAVAAEQNLDANVTISLAVEQFAVNLTAALAA